MPSGCGILLSISVGQTCTKLAFSRSQFCRISSALRLPVSVAWIVFAAWAAWMDFAEGSLAHWGLIVTSLYLALAGILQQIIPEGIRRVR